MNTYLLFAYNEHYPAGGMGDCRAVIHADNDEAAIAEAKRLYQAMGTYHDYVKLARSSGSWVGEVWDRDS